MFKIWIGIEIIVTLNVLKILIHLYFKNLVKWKNWHKRKDGKFRW